MVRRSFVVLAIVAAPVLFAQDGTSPEARLDRGIAAFSKGDAAAAMADLERAAGALLTADRTRSFVESGRFEGLATLERALVYLALAQFRLGQEEEARDSILLLHAAERVTTTYATLSLGAEAREVEALAAALLPGQPLPQNVGAVSDDPNTPLPMLVARRNSETREARQKIVEALVRRPSAAPVAAAVAGSPRYRELYDSLRSGDAALLRGALEEATALYGLIGAAADAPRELLAAAATGLYRIGAYREAVPLFARLGTFALGEEDLRYYYAVTLYESGLYADARAQLSCALPFILETEEVVRYRTKIDLTRASR